MHTIEFYTNKIKELEDSLYNKDIEINLLKKQLRQQKAELEVARTLINSYYEEDKHDINKYLANAKEQELSENAKRFVRDIEKGVI